MEKENQKEHPEEIGEKDLAEAQEYQKPAFRCLRFASAANSNPSSADSGLAPLAQS
jgi:hypothetical protein